MADLHYSRWHDQFVIDEFSSEDSMRDYLANNYRLIFEDNTWIIPIDQEKHLQWSSFLNKESGRADILLCRITEEKEKVLEEKKLLPSSIELWIVELKKVESSYGNGFQQLFDYMTVVRNDNKIQKDILEKIKNSIEKEFHHKEKNFHMKEIENSETPMAVYGSLVAPSFDLIGRTRKVFSEKMVKEGYQQHWKDLEDKLKDRGKITEGFTLIDIVDAASKMFGNVVLRKLIRFKRGDETIIYSENIQGTKAAAQISRIDPTNLFSRGIIKEDDEFYFRDDKGDDHKQVKCKVLNTKGPSSAFMVKIEALDDVGSIEIPKFDKGPPPGWKYVPKTVPTKESMTVKMCSMALHKKFEIYNDAKELEKNYWNFGERHLVRKRGDKPLSELKEEYRLTVK